ncbi:MAG: hypothetical protein ABI614_04930 [Planctomycetota bacterium]
MPEAVEVIRRRFVRRLDLDDAVPQRDLRWRRDVGMFAGLDMIVRPQSDAIYLASIRNPQPPTGL